MLRRRKTDPPFLRRNLVAAVRCGAACEVDIRFTADGHAVCLHDATLDRETTGRGRVDASARGDIELLWQRGGDGAALESPPLFLDEVVAAVAEIGAAPASVQLDVKTRAKALSSAAVTRFTSLLRGHANSFIASAYDWPAVQRLVAATPGLRAGFDPLRLYARPIVLGASGFHDLAAQIRALAPDASMYYLEAKLILAALDCGVSLVRELERNGTQIDAWTIDADDPALDATLARVIEAGCAQITSNDPDHLAPIVAALAAG
jgi:glycerophosphoryl diester phosphodiesterase